MNKRFSFDCFKHSVDISPRNTWMLTDCNYTTLCAYRCESGFSLELHHVIKRGDEFVKIHYHNIGSVRTVVDVYDVAREYVKITRVYKAR